MQILSVVVFFTENIRLFFINDYCNQREQLQTWFLILLFQVCIFRCSVFFVSFFGLNYCSWATSPCGL